MKSLETHSRELQWHQPNLLAMNPCRCILTASWSPWCASQHNAIHIDPPLLQNVDCKRLSTETMNKCPAFPPNLCIAIVDLPLNIIMLVSNTLLILIGTLSVFVENLNDEKSLARLVWLSLETPHICKRYQLFLERISIMDHCLNICFLCHLSHEADSSSSILLYHLHLSQTQAMHCLEWICNDCTCSATQGSGKVSSTVRVRMYCLKCDSWHLGGQSS